MEDWKSYLNNTEVIIHAGGMSERWYPVTQGKTPKVLTEIGKIPRPMIDWTILPYVMAGVKKFFITLWHNPEKIIEHCNEISSNTGIEFVFLKEEEKRMGRAGVIKYYLEKGVLDRTKPKIMVGGSDIVKINLEEFTQTHLDNVSKGFPLTLVGSDSGQTQFDRIFFNPATGQVLKMDINRTVTLDENQCANTGTAYFDSSCNQLFLQIPEDRMPIDWEHLINEFANVSCFRYAKIYDSWFPLKTPYDYKKAKDVDFEKWFDIDSIEKYLGEYKSNSL